MKPRRLPSLRRLLLAAPLLLAAACGEEELPVQELITLRNQGLLELERGQLPEAEARFARLVSAAPNEPLGHANLGLTLLRAGRLEEAAEHLRRARRLDPASVEIGVLLARTLALSGETTAAHEILDELRSLHPAEASVLYALAALHDPEAGGSTERYLEALREVVVRAPASIPVRLRLAELHAEAGRADSARVHLEEVRRIPPEPPAATLPHLEAALAALRGGEAATALEPMRRFHESIRLTAPYQASIAEAGWDEGPLAGRPILTFAPEDYVALRALRAEVGQGAITFEDASAGAGLPGSGMTEARLATGDADGDGRDDLLIAGPEGVTLHRARAGLFQPIPAADVLAAAGPAVDAGFADADNDGWLDVYHIGQDGAVSLALNDREGGFAPPARIGSAPGAVIGRFVDVDHDGDLDLLLAGPSGATLLRNNLDGTFTDISEAWGVSGMGGSDVAFADLNDDGRIDLVLTGGERGAILLLNGGAAGFRDATAQSGLNAPEAATVAIADVDNDGELDLILGGGAGSAGVWRGSVDGTFARDAALAALLPAGDGIVLHPVDHDNDGWLDLLLLSGGDGAPLRLLRNAGGAFEDRSGSLAAAGALRAPLHTFDADADGDLDILAVDAGGALRLIRNDGGNLNRAVRVELRALGTGSGKNNDFGIGARISLRAGDLLQTRVVTGRETHFGLGPHLKGDVLQVEWPNGVPQTIYFPGSDEDVLEMENLKGSCPFLYTWDGEGFRFVTDIMWSTALGMPVGLMAQGGETIYAPPGASYEYLRVPGEMLKPKDGRYLLRLTGELWEVPYIDEVRLLTVDRPDSVKIFVDERFVPPGPVDLRLYRTTGHRPPVSAVDGNGADLLDAVREKDDVYTSNLVPLRYQGLVEPHELIMDLGPEAGDPGSLLILIGWIYPTDASINVALTQQTELTADAPVLDVADGKGGWIAAAAPLSFPAGKDKAIVVELGGLFPSDDRRVRIRTNMRIHWDQVSVARELPALETPVQRLAPLSAELRRRGFSRMFRKGGSSGPHWYDYDDVREESPWRPIRGAYTRYGDVLPLVQTPDDMYVIMSPGDELAFEFDADAAGEPPPGWRRDYLLYTVGWLKDSDLNTALGTTVEPLPFHGMSEYPYPDDEQYPTGEEHQRYLREYNTRIVGRR